MYNQSLPKGVATNASTHCIPKSHGMVQLGDSVSLSRGRVHELQGDSAESLALLAAGQSEGPVFWIGEARETRSLFPLGLSQFIDPERLIVTTGVSRLEVLWATEQALRIEGMGSVVAELQSGPDLRESRRLQIAAEESGAIGLLLIRGRAQTSAAETRWQCEAVPSKNVMWRWACTKSRQGAGQVWDVSWQGGGNGPGIIHMAAAAAA